jgi:hypothetical protein
VVERTSPMSRVTRFQSNGVRVMLRQDGEGKFSLFLDFMTRRDDNSVGEVAFVFQGNNSNQGKNCYLEILDCQNETVVDQNTFDGETFDSGVVLINDREQLP